MFARLKSGSDTLIVTSPPIILPVPFVTVTLLDPAITSFRDVCPVPPLETDSVPERSLMLLTLEMDASVSLMAATRVVLSVVDKLDSVPISPSNSLIAATVLVFTVVVNDATAPTSPSTSLMAATRVVLSVVDKLDSVPISASSSFTAPTAVPAEVVSNATSPKLVAVVLVLVRHVLNVEFRLVDGMLIAYCSDLGNPRFVLFYGSLIPIE